MTVPFTKYLEVKDNYCVSYFGEDWSILDKLISSRDYIESELKGIHIYIACKDQFKASVHGKRNIILESKMHQYNGKMAHLYELVKKDDLKDLLINSKIPIPDNF